MVWLSSLLRRLWPFSRLRPASPTSVALVGAPEGEAVGEDVLPPASAAPAAEPAVETAASAVPDLPGNPYAPLVSNDNVLTDEGEDEEDEESIDDDGDEPLDEDEIGPDPFVKALAPVVVPLAERELASERIAARAEALAGEHRIYISTVAGPGSLAEALNTLLSEGLVSAQFFDEGLEGSFTFYTPTRPHS